MKHYYITTEPPMILSDEELNIDNFCLSRLNEIVKFGKNYDKNLYTKIIAGLPNQLEIDYSDLSDEYCKKIGWVDVEKLANKHCISQDLIGEGYDFNSFIEGFKTSQSLNDKKWSDEDMKLAMFKMFDRIKWDGENELSLFVENYIKQQKQPQVFEIEAIVQDNKVKILKVL